MARGDKSASGPQRRDRGAHFLTLRLLWDLGGNPLKGRFPEIPSWLRTGDSKAIAEFCQGRNIQEMMFPCLCGLK